MLWDRCSAFTPGPAPWLPHSQLGTGHGSPWSIKSGALGLLLRGSQNSASLSPSPCHLCPRTGSVSAPEGPPQSHVSPWTSIHGHPSLPIPATIKDERARGHRPEPAARLGASKGLVGTTSAPEIGKVPTRCQLEER